MYNNYEEFKEAAVRKLKEQILGLYPDATVKETVTNKNNITLDSLDIYLPGRNIHPRYYIDGMYEQYKDGSDIDSIIASHVMQIRNNVSEAEDFDLSPLKDTDTFKRSVLFTLVNTSQNRSRLAGMPHRRFLDMSIVYFISLEGNPQKNGSITITDNLMQLHGLTENELFELAKRNTRENHPETVDNMADVLKPMLFATMPAEDAEIQYQEAKELNLYVLRNNEIKGSSIMLYDDVFQELADRVEDNLYILPSSIHEVMAYPCGTANGDANELASMVIEVNRTQVTPEERLSNNVYLYDRTTHKITQITNTDTSLV